jgi:hypothetical protein
MVVKDSYRARDAPPSCIWSLIVRALCIVLPNVFSSYFSTSVHRYGGIRTCPVKLMVHHALKLLLRRPLHVHRIQLS